MISIKAIFGPAGNSESFKAKKYKSPFDIPKYLGEMGLLAYEYQCGRGVIISKEAAIKFGEISKKAGIILSLHAPYYISMSSIDLQKRMGSINYILKSAKAIAYMGGDRVVIHTGSCAKMTREEALHLAVDTMKKTLEALNEAKLENIKICPETMGKINQLGTVEEVIELCKLDERLYPCIDFGHINARTFGGIKTKADYKNILEKIKNNLGSERFQNFHAHFSKIEYTENGGEKRHLTFDDTTYGPDFEPLAELMAKMNLTPRIICESAGTQAEDAKKMQNIYEEKL